MILYTEGEMAEKLVAQAEVYRAEINKLNLLLEKTTQQGFAKGAEWMREPVYNVLIAGNHLASTLISMIGMPYEYSSYDEVLEKHFQPAADIWIAWKRIMELRDKWEAPPLTYDEVNHASSD